jgi:PAS domain-containing protein
MNKLTEFLVNSILEEDKQEIVALYAGGFKPPTAGHLLVVEEALSRYPEIDKFYVIVGTGVRDEIDQEESLLVWEIYQKYLPMKVEIIPAKKPAIGEVYSYAKNHPDQTIYWVIGGREGREDDLNDIAVRTRAIDKAEDKYNNVEVKIVTTPDANMSGTNARKALLANDKETFFKFLPARVKEKEEIFTILRPAVKENIPNAEDDGKAAPFGSGYKPLNEHSMGNSIDLLPYLAKLTQHMIDKGYNIEPLPGLTLIDDDISNAEDFFGKTAYYDPNEQSIVLYTHGRHPKDIARSYAHEMIHHIQNLEDRLGDITTTNTQEDDRLNDLEAEANLKGTMTFRNWTDSLEEGFNKKLGKDPFGLEQFARELMTEGAYDALTTKLTKATINKWVADFKKDPKRKTSFIDLDIEDVDGKGRDIEFNYVGMLKFDKKSDGYEVDGTSNSGEEEDKIPFIATLFTVNPKVLPQAWSKISADVSDVIRHELEHLTQSGENVRSGKYKDDDIQIRDMINKLKILPQKNYYLLDKEVDAMLQGLYLKAKKTKKPFADVINNYLDIAPGIETPEDKEMILNLWRSRRKALSLPVFENEEEVMDYKIFLDMDGVLVDFDKQFEELTGMPPREFESKHSTEKFWEEIDGAGVGFWRGMKWMPGGEALYNRAAQHDHALLSSPSRSEVSKIGKRLWRRDKTPNTKLILARSYNKKNYAAPNHILIDDREDNIQQWINAGGIGILYKSPEQVNKELDKLGL